MKTITKLNSNLNQYENNQIIDILINKINELTQEINELKFEVSTIQEWKIKKEGI